MEIFILLFLLLALAHSFSPSLRSVKALPKKEDVTEFASVLAEAAAIFPNNVRSCMYIYMDYDGDAVAYNHGGSLFFNLRFYLQVHRPRLQKAKANSRDDVLHEVRSAW